MLLRLVVVSSRVNNVKGKRSEVLYKEKVLIDLGNCFTVFTGQYREKYKSYSYEAITIFLIL